MSGANNENLAPGAAFDIQARAAEFLIERGDQKQWSPEDEAALNAWLSLSLAHRTAYWRLESVWGRADRLNALRPLSPRGGPANAMSRRRSVLFGIAASVVVIVAIGASTSFLVPRPATTTYATPIGGRETIQFVDGSRIDLNTDTVLRARFDNGQRSVELVKGEALFQIKHDATHPFVVLAAGHRVTDLGTKFLIREDNGRIRVTLMEGSAQLASAATGTAAKSAVLTPGDEAIATAEGFSIARKSPAALEAELGWRRGVVVFQRATLDEVAKEYNRYNRRKIIIGDSKAGSRIITATLPINDVGAFARMVRNFLKLHVEENSDEIVISR